MPSFRAGASPRFLTGSVFIPLAFKQKLAKSKHAAKRSHVRLWEAPSSIRES